MQNYRQINLLLGGVVFLISLLVYWSCMEPTLSFWDCGEFIAAAYKLEVGHQPGAPLFLMLGKIFSLFAGSNAGKIAYWVNFQSVVVSAATITFLFWSINLIALKLIKKEEKELSQVDGWSVLAAGLVGAFCYAFSDTFWFSAVEAEVYALSSLVTALVFWCILKWEKELNDRWLLVISFLVGLSIGVHLLSLLIIPPIALVYYFRKSKRPTWFGAFKAFLAGGMILGLIQFGIIQYFVLFAAKTDVMAVNQWGLPFGSGALIFLLFSALLLAYGIRYSIRKSNYRLHLGLLCLTFVLFGFSSYFMIIIRANAKPNINLSNPDTPLSLFDYLSRTQYEDKPILYGKVFDSKAIDIKEGRENYRRGESRYEVIGKSYQTVYDKNMLFPRTYSNRPQHVQFYKNWMNLGENESPGFWQNMRFFMEYQLGFMYGRYFAWNFIGRQNDVQGHGSLQEGNWLTGIKALDALRLDNQQNLPPSMLENAGRNLFYGLPFLLGMAGLIYLSRRSKSDLLVIGSLFFCTGLAIIIYINQDPMQVRERDYAYVGSFYAFAIFIGLGMLAIQSFLSKKLSKKHSLLLSFGICLFAVPGWMAFQGWDDHDRSGKTTALDMAKNYLNSCEPNAILFTNADNDTYPLWYAQEVEGIRTDVRVVNLQFLSSESYIDQMKKQQDLSAPLPIRMNKETYKEGSRNYLPYYDYGIQDSVELSDLLAVLTSDSKEDKIAMSDGSLENFLPTQRFKMKVDPEKVLRTGTVQEADSHRITSQLEWNFNKNFALKSDLAIFDILVHNQWERPVYFAASLSEDTYIGLDKYLYLEGFAYRLLPFRPSEGENFTKTAQTNDLLAHDHYVNRFELKGFKTARYLDPESKRILHSTFNFSNTLAQNLLRNGRTEAARQVVHKSLNDLPLRNTSISDTVNKIGLVNNLLQLKENEKANAIANDAMNYLAKEFNYILSLKSGNQHALIQEIRTGFFVFQELKEAARFQKHEALWKKAEAHLQHYEKAFMKSFG